MQALAALTVSLGELSAGGHLITLTALTVLGHNYDVGTVVNMPQREEEKEEASSSDGGASSAAPGSGASGDVGSGAKDGSSSGAGIGQFITRVLRSAYERRAEFSALELSCLLEECLPRLDADDDGGSGAGFRVPSGLAVGMARELTSRGSAAVEGGAGGGGGDDEGEASVASVLVEYVSLAFLQGCLGLSVAG